MNRTPGSARQHGFEDGFTTCQAAPIAGRSMLVGYDGATLLGSHEVAKRTHRKIAFKGTEPVDMRSRTGYNVLTRDNELMF